MARSTPYQFSVSVTDNGCPPKTTNVVFSVFVTTSPASQYPSVVVQQNPPGMICQGSQVSFSAAPTLPGTNPLFTWYLNGTPVASGSPVFSPQSVSNGDIVSVTMITNAPCLLNDTAQSPPYVVQVNPQPAPQVSLTSNPALLLCPQQICLFTAAVANGGASPSYQWNLNGANTGTNNHLFTAANPSGLMAVFVTVTPSTGCPPVSSDTIVFNIQPWLTPQVQIVSNSPDSLCPGEEVMLRATATNTGSPPVFTWLFNTSQLNHPFDTLTIAALTANDSIRVQVTSNYECLSPSVATSDPYFIRIYPPLQANLTDGPIEVCAGTPVDLLMNASGGNTSTYQFSWDPGIDDDPEITVYPVNSGTWYATVDEICYDAITDSVEITAFPVPSASYSFTPEHPAVYDPVVTFTNLSTGSDSWLWKFGDGAMTDDFSPVHVYPSGGKFPVTLIAFNQNGCTDTATRLLEVEQPVIGFIPNSFTPNGDGINDSFGIEGEATGGYSLRIFNRWGQEVFSSPNGYQRWDGKFGDGKPAPAGIYTYVAVLANDPARKPVTGSVSLIR
jgi:gliding motility-associated-like protein